MVDVIDLVRRFEKRILNGVNGRMVYRHARTVVLDIMTPVAKRRLDNFWCLCRGVS